MSNESFDDDRTRDHTVLIKDTQIGRYRIEKQIGAGGMGEVYLAEDTELDRQVALKFLPSHMCKDEDCRKRFKREAQAAAKLSHPNIIHVYEVSEFKGRPFFAMEHVEGRSLRDVKSEELDIDRIVGFAIQLCDGLQTAHSAGVTHRDIKPSNIVIGSSGRPKLLDFGLATVKGGEHLTKTGSTLGTVGYMSPEQIEGKATDARSDLFSLGVVLYELIANKSPFKRDDETATFKAIIQDTPEPLARYKSGVPEDLQRIVSKLLEKDPTMRYQSAAGVIPDLKKLAPSRTSGVLVEKKRDWWNRYVVPVAVVFMLVVLAVWYFGYREQKSDSSKSDEKIMLAVLPFENLGDPEDEYFADGISEEIATRLVTVKYLGIIGATSSMRYKGTRKSASQIGDELGVDYILKASVRWQQDTDGTSRVRVTPQLINTINGTNVWADVYEEQLTEVFAVQASIANKVANVLGIVLAEPQQAELSRPPTRDVTAYNYYLRGRQLARRFVGDDRLRDAIEMYEKAYTKDTLFAQAMADAATQRFLLYWFGYHVEESYLQEALDLAKRAITLEPSNALTHAAMGYYYYYGRRDYSSALHKFQTALRLEPENSELLRANGLILRRMGRFEEALDYIRRAVRLDPLARRMRTNFIELSLYMRRFQEIESYLDESVALFPEYALIYWSKAHFYLLRDGDAETAIAVLNTSSAMVDFQTDYQTDIISELCFCYEYSGQFDELLDAATRLLEYSEVPYDTAEYFYYTAMAHFHTAGPDASRMYLDSARAYYEGVRSRDLPPGGRNLKPVSVIYAALGMKEKAIAVAIEDTTAVPYSKDPINGYEFLENLALTHVMVGQPDSAITILERLLRVPYGLSAPYLKNREPFAPLRDHPRFKALIEKYEMDEDGT